MKETQKKSAKNYSSFDAAISRQCLAKAKNIMNNNNNNEARASVSSGSRMAKAATPRTKAQKKHFYTVIRFQYNKFIQ